jgi:hypothetical protein
MHRQRRTAIVVATLLVIAATVFAALLVAVIGLPAARAHRTTGSASIDNHHSTVTMGRTTSDLPEDAAATPNAWPQSAIERRARFWVPFAVRRHGGDTSPNRDAIARITASPTR